MLACTVLPLLRERYLPAHNVQHHARACGVRLNNLPMSTQLARKNESGLPPIIAGRFTPAVRERAQQFFSSLASLFEA